MMNAGRQSHVVRALHTLLTQTVYGGKQGARLVDFKVIDAGPLGLAVSAKVEVGAQPWDDAAPPLMILVFPEVATPAAKVQ